MKQILAFSTMSLFFVLLACESKECKEIRQNYKFQIPVALSPALDTFHIGDTIWIQSIIDKMVFDIETGAHYLLEDYQFHPTTSMGKMDQNTTDKDALRFFNYGLISETDYEYYRYSGGISTLKGEYAYDGKKYELVYFLVPREKGLFVFFHSLLFGFRDEHQPFPGKCPKVPADAVTLLNNGSDNNIEFLQHSPDPHYRWVLEEPEDRFHRGGGYCFYVVE